MSFIPSVNSVLAMDINSVSKVSLVDVVVDTVVTSTSNNLEEPVGSPIVVESVPETV